MGRMECGQEEDGTRVPIESGTEDRFDFQCVTAAGRQRKKGAQLLFKRVPYGEVCNSGR